MSETNSSYPYASARIKASESALITRDKLNRIIEAKDFDTASRLLSELGYGHQQAGGGFEDMIAAEL